MKAFKVLFVSAYNPFVVGSGPGNGLYFLSQALSKIGCEVHILTPKINTPVSFDESIQIHYYDNLLKGKPFGESWFFFSLLSNRQTREICKNYDIDIINGRSPSTFGYALLKPSVPFVVSVHGSSFGELSALYNVPPKYWNRTLIKNGTVVQPMWSYLTNMEYQVADYLFPVSGAVADELINYYHLDPAKIIVIQNGVVKVEPKEAEEDKLILSIGRMVWRKGFLYLIRAMPKILKKFPQAKLVLVGEGPYKRWLMDCVKNSCLEQSVFFWNNLSKDKLFEVYAKAQVYVQPSLYEPLCNTVLEAMACRRPVIASRVGGLPEIITHQKNGLLVDPGNVNQLAESIEFLLSNEYYRKKLAQNGQETVRQNFSWEKKAMDTLQAYKQIVQN